MSGFRSAVGGNTGSGQAARPGGGSLQPPFSQNAPDVHDTRSSRWWEFGVTTWLLIVGLVVINVGMFVSPELLERLGGRIWRLLSFVDVRYWPWWYWPIFWIIVIGAVTRYLLTGRIEMMEAQREDSTQHYQLRRLITILTVGLTALLICVHANIFTAFRHFVGQLLSSDFPWWGMPLFWSLLIGVLVAVWMLQRYLEQGDRQPSENRSTLLWTAVGGGAESL